MDVMLEDQKLMRLVTTQRDAMTSMMREFESRTHGCDRVAVDAERGRITYFQGGLVHWDACAELIGIFMTDIERWRWWWVLPGTETAKKQRIDVAFATGKDGGVHTLTARNPSVSTENEARLLARLCASLAAAHGVHAESGPDRVTYYALFQESEAVAAGPHAAMAQQYNTMLPPSAMIPPSSRGPLPRPPASPAVALPPPPRAPLMSMFPGAPAPKDAPPPSTRIPRTDVPPRVPARELVRPLALHAHALVVQQVPGGFRNAVVVLYTEVRAGKVRFSVLVVASDPRGDLVVLDATPDMMQDVQTLLTEDARSGNGAWTRLTIHLTPTASGASMDVQVKA
jgi:hypothetical protein